MWNTQSSGPYLKGFKGDKLEFITQKVTELGASQIWAFPADWSVAKWDGKNWVKG